MNRFHIAKFVGMTLAMLIVMSAPVWADDDDGYLGGYGSGYGMMGGGHGMGMGSGMMGPEMMGPGMMGGFGGHGQMGMMGYGALGMLDLTDDQRTKIEKIQNEERKQHLAVMSKMLDVHSKMRELYLDDEPDPKKAGAVYAEMTKLQQQMLETHVTASNQMKTLLTKEQRDQLKKWNRGGWGPRGDNRGMHGPGNMPGGMMGR